MNRVLTFIVMVCALQQIAAQDFTSLLLKKSKADSLFTQITVSPKMMHEILEQNISNDEQITDFIANLKCMRMLVSVEQSAQHFELAIDLLNQSPKFKLTKLYEAGSNGHIAIREKKNVIVELVFLRLVGHEFALIDFTGEMTLKQISALADGWKEEKKEL